MPTQAITAIRSFPKANWSIVLQIAAESDLIMDMISIYGRIAKVGSVFGKVNLIVLFDGLKIPGLKIPEKPSVYYVRQSVFFDKECETPILTYKDDDLTKPDGFSKVMSDIIEKFPAENWAYFYCGHSAAGGTDITNGKYRVKLDHRLIVHDEEESDEAMEKRLRKKYETDQWMVHDILLMEKKVNDRAVLVLLRRK